MSTTTESHVTEIQFALTDALIPHAVFFGGNSSAWRIEVRKVRLSTEQLNELVRHGFKYDNCFTLASGPGMVKGSVSD